MEVYGYHCLTTMPLLVSTLNVTSEMQREVNSYHNEFHRSSPRSHLSCYTTESGICTSHCDTSAGVKCMILKQAKIYTALDRACHV